MPLTRYERLRLAIKDSVAEFRKEADADPAFERFGGEYVRFSVSRKIPDITVGEFRFIVAEILLENRIRDILTDALEDCENFGYGPFSIVDAITNSARSGNGSARLLLQSGFLGRYTFAADARANSYN